MSMLQVSNFRVKSLDLDYLDLFWEIENTKLNPHDFTFVVERSESAMGPWQPISEAFEDKYHFRDIEVNLLHKWRQYWYRIKITRKADSEVAYSDAVRLQAPPDLIAGEVRRLERMLFTEFVGRRCYLFPVRTFGQKCSCFDTVTGHQTRSHCLECYDTSFVRGFLDPVEIWVQFDPTPQAIQPLQVMETHQQNTTARMGDFPPAKPRDIIVEAGENVRWRVERVIETQRLRAVLHQELQLHAIPKSDIEFKLPINLSDYENVDISPGRNFTNPQQLEATDDTEFFKKITGVHGYEE